MFFVVRVCVEVLTRNGAQNIISSAAEFMSLNMCMLSVCAIFYIRSYIHIREMKRCWSWLTQRKRVSVSDNWLPVTIILSLRHIEREAYVRFFFWSCRHKVQFLFLMLCMYKIRQISALACFKWINNTIKLLSTATDLTARCGQCHRSIEFYAYPLSFSLFPINQHKNTRMPAMVYHKIRRKNENIDQRRICKT